MTATHEASVYPIPVFSEASRKVLNFASEEARKYRNDLISPELLLFFLLKDETVRLAVGQIAELSTVPLLILDLNPEYLWEKRRRPIYGPIELSASAKAVIKNAQAQAEEKGVLEISPMYLLRGIAEEGQSEAARLLLKRQITEKRIDWWSEWAKVD